MTVEIKKTKRTTTAVVWRATVSDDEGNKIGSFLARKDEKHPDGEYQMAYIDEADEETVEEEFDAFKEGFREAVSGLELLTVEEM